MRATLKSLLAAGACCAAPLTVHAQTAQRPDIVLFIADDMSREDVGVYGSRDARTPNIDALAKAGLRFTNAFAASPTCTPSRSAMYTGDYPIRNGAHANHSPIKATVKTLPEYLQKLGYRVVIAGKTDIGARSDFPFEYLADSTLYPPGKHDALSGILGTAAIDKLLATRDKTKPLALVVADYASHVPWPDNDGYDAKALTLSPDLYDTEETRTARTRYLSKVTLADRDLGAVRASIAKHGGAANTLFLFTADQGAQLPFAKWNLYDAGIATPLIAAWPGHVAPGRTTGAMVSLVDLLPTIEAAAGGPPLTGVDGKSFLPVLYGKADTFRTEIYAAHSGDRGSGPNVNIAPSRTIRTGRYKLIENLRPDIRFVDAVSQNTQKRDNAYWLTWVEKAKTDPRAAFMVHRFYQRQPLELYDLNSDPFELKNLVTDPAQATTLKQLKTRLDAWRVSQGETLDHVIMPGEAQPGHFPYNTCPCTGVTNSGAENDDGGE